MATAQLTASSISVSVRSLASFEGLRPSTVKFASFGTLKAGGAPQRSFRGLVVKAATVVAPKVSSLSTVELCSLFNLLYGLLFSFRQMGFGGFWLEMLLCLAFWLYIELGSLSGYRILIFLEAHVCL